MGCYNVSSMCPVVDDLCDATTDICIGYVYLFSTWRIIMLLDCSAQFTSHANGTYI